MRRESPGELVCSPSDGKTTYSRRENHIQSVCVVQGWGVLWLGAGFRPGWLASKPLLGPNLCLGLAAAWVGTGPLPSTSSTQTPNKGLDPAMCCCCWQDAVVAVVVCVCVFLVGEE